MEIPTPRGGVQPGESPDLSPGLDNLHGRQLRQAIDRAAELPKKHSGLSEDPVLSGCATGICSCVAFFAQITKTTQARMPVLPPHDRDHRAAGIPSRVESVHRDLVG